VGCLLWETPGDLFCPLSAPTLLFQICENGDVIAEATFKSASTEWKLWKRFTFFILFNPCYHPTRWVLGFPITLEKFVQRLEKLRKTEKKKTSSPSFLEEQ
jgi:hypothetical protein